MSGHKIKWLCFLKPCTSSNVFLFPLTYQWFAHIIKFGVHNFFHKAMYHIQFFPGICFCKEKMKYQFDFPFMSILIFFPISLQHFSFILDMTSVNFAWNLMSTFALKLQVRNISLH